MNTKTFLLFFLKKKIQNINLKVYMFYETTIAPILAHLINKSLSTGIFLTSEKIAKVIPAYKSESKSSMNNYRPISVLPIMSKVFERIVHTQLSKYLEKHKLLSNNQYGFRNRRSTQQAVTILTDSVALSIDELKYTGAVFLDLRKAFDMVDHERLLLKLDSFGVSATEQNWFIDYLFNRKQYVSYNSTSSNLMSITRGVPQGSILGLLLFLLFINDIDKELEKSFIVC